MTSLSSVLSAWRTRHISRRQARQALCALVAVIPFGQLLSERANVVYEVTGGQLAAFLDRGPNFMHLTGAGGWPQKTAATYSDAVLFVSLDS